MYRHRMHLTVKDMDGWNEVLSVVAALNKVSERLGLPTARLWTESFGPYNHLVAEVDFPDLAAYEAADKQLWDDPEAMSQLSRLSPVTVQGTGYNEMMQT